MQAQSSNGKCMKIHASLKHYTAYSVESDRSGIDEIISTFDIHDSYLPQYERAFVKGRAAGVMCSCESPSLSRRNPSPALLCSALLTGAALASLTALRRARQTTASTAYQCAATRRS